MQHFGENPEYKNADPAASENPTTGHTWVASGQQTRYRFRSALVKLLYLGLAIAVVAIAVLLFHPF